MHYICGDPKITHLCFADDLIAFFRGDEESAKALADTIHLFGKATGLHVNFQKSLLFVAGMNLYTQTRIAEILNLNVGTLPVKYLGLPLVTSRLQYDDCLPLIKSRRESRLGKDGFCHMQGGLFS